MPKYLFHASYSAEGLHGLDGDSASGRRADVEATIKAAGGKMEAFYFAFGSDDVIIVLDLPDNVTAAAVSLGTSSSGLVRVRTTPLLTVEEVDRALQVKLRYRAPGQ